LGRWERCIQGFGGKTRKDLGIDERIISKWIFKK
jgi:hypothetical protein